MVKSLVNGSQDIKSCTRYASFSHYRTRISTFASRYRSVIITNNRFVGAGIQLANVRIIRSHQRHLFSTHSQNTNTINPHYNNTEILQKEKTRTKTTNHFHNFSESLATRNEILPHEQTTRERILETQKKERRKEGCINDDDDDDCRVTRTVVDGNGDGSCRSRNG